MTIVAREAVREQLAQLEDRNVRDAAVVVLDTKTGQVLAYVGNGGADYSSAPQIDGVRMRRQAGSTLKPFVLWDIKKGRHQIELKTARGQVVDRVGFLVR